MSVANISNLNFFIDNILVCINVEINIELYKIKKFILTLHGEVYYCIIMSSLVYNSFPSSKVDESVATIRKFPQPGDEIFPQQKTHDFFLLLVFDQLLKFS